VADYLTGIVGPPALPGASQESQRRIVASLGDATAAITAEVDPAAALQRIAEQAAAVLRAEASSVLVLSDDGSELTFRTAVGPTSAALIGTSFGATLGIAGRAVQTGQPVRVDDVRREKAFYGGIDSKTGGTTRSLIAAPLIHRDKTLGVVEVLNPRGRKTFSGPDLEVLRVFANLAGGALAAARAQPSARGIAPGKGLVAVSPAMRRTLDLCRKAAASSATVLLQGETGTGKLLLAEMIHDLSDRRRKPFVVIDCGSYRRDESEAELWGTEHPSKRIGLVEKAHGGTLFLDEIGDMSPALQARIEALIDHRAFFRCGGSEIVPCDVRLITSTHADLAGLMTKGQLRSDLYHRLNVIRLTLPPLRQRQEDIASLVEHSLADLRPEGPKVAVAPGAMERLLAYPWPGNVRELRNVLQRALVMIDGDTIGPGDLPDELVGKPAA
jgi:transcriptional regulator with GAF, ATPase, and Fis domain